MAIGMPCQDRQGHHHCEGTAATEAKEELFEETLELKLKGT